LSERCFSSQDFFFGDRSIIEEIFDPIQIGLGARVAGVDSNLQQGSLEATGRDLDSLGAFWTLERFATALGASI